jgi:hypothetical protein
MPITTTNGGISAVKSVILYPSKTTVPRLHTTPMLTTSKLMNVALTERKKINKVITNKTNEPIKEPIHFIFDAVTDGCADKRKSAAMRCYICTLFKLPPSFNISLISRVRLLLLMVSLSTVTPII